MLCNTLYLFSLVIASTMYTNFAAKYRKYKDKYLNLCKFQKGGVKTPDPPNTTKFDNVTLIDKPGKPNTRLRKELRKIFSVYEDVTYNENIINIPSKNMQLTIPRSFPFGKDMRITVNDISYIAKWAPIGFTMIGYIDQIIKGDTSGLRMIVDLSLLIDGKIMRHLIALDNIHTMTVNQFTDYIQKNILDDPTHYISRVRFNGNVIYSPMREHVNKKICDFITSSFKQVHVTAYELLSESNLINYMRNATNLTTTLSRQKIVSTPETTGSSFSIIQDHLNLYKDNIKYIMQSVFGQDGVCVKYSDSPFNPVIFYIDEYLKKFADKLKQLEEFRDIENLPDYLLAQLGSFIKREDNLLHTVMLILFGGVQSGEMSRSNFTPDKNVLELYNEYLEDVTQ